MVALKVRDKITADSAIRAFEHSGVKKNPCLFAVDCNHIGLEFAFRRNSTGRPAVQDRW